MVMIMTAAPQASAQIRTTTDDGTPLDEPFLIRLGEEVLRIPAGYLGPWPRPEARGRISAPRPLNLNFWMPARRYVEIGDFSIAGFRPKEPGRGEPPEGASVIRVNDLQLLRERELGNRSPEKRFENFTSFPAPSSYSFKEEEFGLVRYWQHDWPHPQPEPFVNYRHMYSSDPQINLRCTPPHLVKGASGPGVNPMCEGYVYIAPERLSFYIWLSGTSLPRWREYVFAVRDLVNSWKVQ